MVDDNQKEMLKQAARYSGLGIEMALVFGLAVYTGRYLDKWLDLHPYGLLGCMAVALAIIVRRLIGIARAYSDE